MDLTVKDMALNIYLIVYHKQTKKDMIIDGSNDDIGASEIVIIYYKKSLIFCKGVLYVNNYNIWICGDKQVDKLLIDMIVNWILCFLVQMVSVNIIILKH